MTEDRGSEGRFVRIEGALDAIKDDVSDLRVAVARIESSLNNTSRSEAKRVSDSTYTWMIRGIVASFLIGVASFVARVFGVSI